MRVPSILGATSAIALAAALACGPKATTVSPSAFPESACLSFSFTPLSDTITVALFEPVDPTHAPRPHNDAERLVFNHLYARPLVNGCGGRGLMELRPVKETNRFVLALNETARFWDGSSVSVDEVIESLCRGLAPCTAFDSVVAIDRRSIEVFGPRFDPSGGSLTVPLCSIAKPTASPWPMGSGFYRIVEDATSPGVIVVRPAFEAKSPIIRFVDHSKDDSRDVLDSSAFDIMITSDRNTIEYAQGQGDLRVEGLTSNRAYLLLSATRVASLARGSEPPRLPSSTCVNLANDAVQSAVARGESGEDTDGYWWTDVDGCQPLSISPLSAQAGSVGQIMFDTSDRTARELTERIVALSIASSQDAIAIRDAVPGLVEAHPVATGVGPEEFSASLARGDAFAYVVAVRFRTSDPCVEVGNLMRAAPWLASTSEPLVKVVLPLVSTRPFAIIRDRPQVDWLKYGANLDYFGNLTIVRIRYGYGYR